MSQSLWSLHLCGGRAEEAEDQRHTLRRVIEDGDGAGGQQPAPELLCDWAVKEPVIKGVLSGLAARTLGVYLVSGLVEPTLSPDGLDQVRAAHRAVRMFELL